MKFFKGRKKKNYF